MGSSQRPTQATCAPIRLVRDQFARADRAQLSLKLTGIATFLLLTNGDVGTRSLVGYAFFSFAWALSILSLIHVAFFGGWLARLVWTVLVVAATIVGTAFRIIYDAPLRLADANVLLSSAGDVNSAFAFYGRVLVWPTLLGLLGLAAINLPPFALSAGKPRRWRDYIRQSAVRTSPIVVMVAALLVKNGEGTNGLAVQHAPHALLTVLAIERALMGPPPVRQPVTMAHSGHRPLRNLIVVMDESIRGDLIDLNLEGGAATALAGRPDVINFGVISSIANCSYATNAGFRYGIGRHDHLRQLAAHPSIWAYAKRAGYRTYFFDAQRSNGVLTNGMDEREHAEIDVHYQVAADRPPREKDVDLARALRRMMDEPSARPRFIYVNKMGAHFPFEGKYPLEHARRSPVMETEYFGTEVDPAGAFQRFRESHVIADEVGVRFRNSYHNAVSWNTSRFFEVLLDGLDLSDTLILYTADHGVNLHDDGRPGLNTHCTSGEANPDEGRVPLAVVTADIRTSAALRAAAAINVDRLSQFSVFPSVLRWMGYPAEAVAANPDFDPAIEEPAAASARQFLSTFFVRLGGKPVWNAVPAAEHAIKAREPRPRKSGGDSAPGSQG